MQLDRALLRCQIDVVQIRPQQATVVSEHRNTLHERSAFLPFCSLHVQLRLLLLLDEVVDVAITEGGPRRLVLPRVRLLRLIAVEVVRVLLLDGEDLGLRIVDERVIIQLPLVVVGCQVMLLLGV